MKLRSVDDLAVAYTRSLLAQLREKSLEIRALKEYIITNQPASSANDEPCDCREVGGTMVTLAALCQRIGVNLPEAAQDELTRLKGKHSSEMRDRHNAKPLNIRSV